MTRSPEHGALSVSVDVSAVPREPVGAGRFTLDLVRVLAGREDVVLTLWCRRNDGVRWVGETRPSRRDASAAGSATAARDGQNPPVRPVAPSGRPFRLLWEQARLPALVDRAGVRVHHGPHYTMPERARVPCVVTVHDLTFFDHPEWHERTKVHLFRRAISVAARRATAVLCVSRRTAERLEELCRPTGRVFVVPHGVDHDHFNDRTSPHDEDLVRALGVHPPYILFLGTLEPRKAVPELVSAFDRIAQSDRSLSLVLAGRPGWGARAVDAALGSARHAARVVRTGYVPDDALPALLRRATAVAYPAKEEGFGLPALEALACGAPLVTTSGTVMAELAGDAALTVRPGSVDELAEALEASSRGDGVGERRRLGLEIAARYTWEASAQAHVAAYRWAAGDR